jgi:hypothetical protein
MMPDLSNFGPNFRSDKQETKKNNKEMQSIYLVGSNSNFIKTNKTIINNVLTVPFKQNGRIKHVACGETFLVVVTDLNRVFAQGNATCGEFGLHGNGVTEQWFELSHPDFLTNDITKMVLYICCCCIDSWRVKFCVK